MNEREDTYRNMGEVTGQGGYVQGRMAADMAHMSEKIDRIEALCERLMDRLTALENRELERKGAIKLAIWSAGVVGAVVSWLATHFVK